MDTDRSNSSASTSIRRSPSNRYSKRERKKPEVFDHAKAETRPFQPDLKVKFKVTKCQGLKVPLGSKQFLAERVWQASFFTRKVLKELGLSAKYQYTILIFDSEKGWVKLSNFSQLTPNCKLRVYQVKPRQPIPKPEQPAAPTQTHVQPTQLSEQQSQLYQQSMMYAYNMLQLQQMMMACQQYSMPYFYY